MMFRFLVKDLNNKEILYNYVYIYIFKVVSVIIIIIIINYGEKEGKKFYRFLETV